MHFGVWGRVDEDRVASKRARTRIRSGATRGGARLDKSMNGIHPSPSTNALQHEQDRTPVKNPAPVCSRALALRMLKDTVGHGIVGDIKIVRITPDENGRLGDRASGCNLWQHAFCSQPIRHF